MTITPKMNLIGAMGLIKKANAPLIPLYEALTNSLEALASKNFADLHKPEIVITFNFVGLTNEDKDLDTIEIFDNGIGFTDENYNRFSEFFDKSKGYNNRGTGRLQFHHRFDLIEVDSVFRGSSSVKSRSFSCNTKSFIHNLIEDTAVGIKETYSKITMSMPILNTIERNFFNDLTAPELAHEITQKFLLRFYLDNQKSDYQVPQITLIFNKNRKEIGKAQLWDSAIPDPKTTGVIEVKFKKVDASKKEDKIEWLAVANKKEKISWAHFEIDQADLNKNAIYLCSKDIAVQNFPIKELRKNDVYDGKRYLTVFYGDVLDRPENVSDSVDSFTFPDRKEVEKKTDDLFFNPDEEYLFMDDIEERIKSELPIIYREIYSSIEQKKLDVGQIAKSHGISSDAANLIQISPSDNEETITTKLYVAQAQKVAKQGYKVNQVFESLRSLNPTANNYQEDLTAKSIELSDLVDEQNKEELSRYILRREMVANVLKKILGEELKSQKQDSVNGKRIQREAIVHDLIFKRKASTNSLNDLWILNEEFLHFEGTSELPLLQIKNEAGELLIDNVPKDVIGQYNLNLNRRPDIFLFADEGKCTIIELKAPDVDVSDYLNQMPKYCTLIANYSKTPIHNFFCYLIGEKFNPMTDLNEYEETVTGDWIRQDMKIRRIGGERETIAKQQIEIIKLSSIQDRAFRRNKSFADKLGIRNLLD